jgi:dCTP deaminase
MSVLSDRDIRAAMQAGRVRLDPYDPTCLQPSSVDLHLDREFRVFRNNRYPYIDVRQPQPDLTEIVAIEDEEPFILHPGEFVLGQTLEWVELPDDLVARLEGKSSLGRLGLLIHSTAGYVDPGWKGNLTMELSNVANMPIALYCGMKIG